MSLSGNPASRKRLAMASAAAVTLPTESVVLISISCLKMSSASFRVASSAGDSCCACIETTNIADKNRPNHNCLDFKSILQKDCRKKFCHALRLKANRFVTVRAELVGANVTEGFELQCRTADAPFRETPSRRRTARSAASYPTSPRK